MRNGLKSSSVGYIKDLYTYYNDKTTNLAFIKIY
jgi:hypothetical protein